MKFNNKLLSSDKTFGLFFAVIFTVIGVLLYKHSISSAFFFYMLAGVFVLIAIVKPAILRPFIKLWKGIGELIGMIVSPIIIGVLYFGLITPFSLLMKLFGRDELRLKLENRKSYWKMRELDDQISKSFKNQF